MTANEAKEIANKPYQSLINKIEVAAKSGKYVASAYLLHDEIKHLESLGYKLRINFNNEYDILWGNYD